MATRASRPTRTLLVFAAVIAVMYIAVASLGTWKPKLGLDLQGGTRITLQASAVGGSVTSEKLQQAVDIIGSRVNGAGVSEAEVTTQGNNIVTVEIPGKVDSDLAQTIGSTAQLRFRVVAAVFPPVAPTQPASPSPSGASPTGTTPTGSTPTGSTPTGSTPTGATPPGTGTSSTGPSLGTPSSPNKNRPAPRLDKAPAPSPAAATGSATPPAPTTPLAPTTPPTGSSTAPTTPAPTTAPVTPAKPRYSIGAPSALSPPDLLNIPDPFAWVKSPPQDWQQRAATYQCPANGKTVAKQLDVPSQPLISCDEEGQRYLLGPAVVEGTDVTDASAGIPQGEVNYAVTLSFNGTGSREFRDVTTRTAVTNTSSPNAGEQVAIVLDGKVLSAPTNQQVIPNGEAIITGSQANPFTQTSSSNLANALKYGALPLSFTIQDTTTQGPELASGQLDAGILAGIVGLILVVAYCLLYYRALAFVVISSLVIAGLVTYASVLLLAHAYGFTLTLPGIAGLIVAVGITADSFIVYFERLRDEVRDGKTLRTSVETGWVRARSTILAADAVSMLAALVLFIFAIGVVKGFAFALGLTTFIDIFVVFFFTKPVVTLLSRTRFFGQGHRLSGLDRGHLGMAPLTQRKRPARGEA
ncbi:MAG: protein translocase subunit SecD [Nocardioidaceae bacterium]